MRDAIVVPNAGSSSLKFSVFTPRDGSFELIARGQTEGVNTTPRLGASDSPGKRLGRRASATRLLA